MQINSQIDYHPENMDAPWVCKLYVEHGPDLWFGYMSEEIVKDKMIKLKQDFNENWFKEAMKGR